MYTQTDINNIVQKFLGLMSVEFPVREAYLFGSYAKGNAREYSDIDLAVVSDNFEGIRFFDRNKLNKFLIKSSVEIEVHPYKTENFTQDDPLVKEIIETGIKII